MAPRNTIVLHSSSPYFEHVFFISSSEALKAVFYDRGSPYPAGVRTKVSVRRIIFLPSDPFEACPVGAASVVLLRTKRQHVRSSIFPPRI